MNSDLVLARLRTFLFALAGVLFVGTFAELVFTNHTKEPVQWIPFVLCALGIVVIAAALLRPTRAVLTALRVSMIVIALGSLFGLYEHISNNIEFYVEIHPRATPLEMIVVGLGGANPLVAPGILAVAGVLAFAATYSHPALTNGVQAVTRAAGRHSVIQ